MNASNLFSMIPISFITLDVQSGLTKAKDEVLELIKFMVNNIAIPIILSAMAGILIFNIAKAIKKHHGAEPYTENIIAIIVVVICIAIVASSPLWIWDIVTQSTAGAIMV